MTQPKKIIPFSLKDAPALIEYAFPVQRLSIDVFRERTAGTGQALTVLGSYWKGRKPLILNKACVLGALLPATSNIHLDLEIFELLMGMDEQSMAKRLNLKADEDLPSLPYSDLAKKAKRPDEIGSSLYDHIWPRVNNHLGTDARNFPELIEQLGLMRYGRRPIVADTFSGSGQIPFAAAQLGCDVYASDLNPVACMLTWGAFNIIGAKKQDREVIEESQKYLVSKVKEEIDLLNIERDGKGWRGKIYLYCLEVLCPTSGWRVPVLPSRVVSKGRKVIAELVPDPIKKRYEIIIKSNVSDKSLKDAEIGTYQKEYLVHAINGVEHRNKISSIRGDFSEVIDGRRVNKNKLRQWELSDICFKEDDIYSERLYAIQWAKDDGSSRPEIEYRTVTQDDLDREEKVNFIVSHSLSDWQTEGWIPDMRIEAGDKTDEPIRTRGWTYWHHLFNPRQLLYFALIKKYSTVYGYPFIGHALNWNARLSTWNRHAGSEAVQQVFINQALNTVYDYGCRGSSYLFPLLGERIKFLNPIMSKFEVINESSNQISYKADCFITDPPYGDAVKYEEILEFFISWLRKNPPKEFENWIWDSRRALAVKGEDHDFKLSMVNSYKRMTDCMPDNGIQIIMFTHQSGSIWADMANIVWASGLQVTAAWYVVTETDSALRDGQYVKGTILLVLRKRLKTLDIARDELAYELADEVKKQVDLLTGLNKEAGDLYKDENLFEDADLQMAGYAAALRVLTRYKTIDGVDMPQESLRPRAKGQKTMVDELIEFAVNIANEYLVPEGMDTSIWEKSTGIERLYLKMLDMESKGIFTLSNYQNFAKAFKVRDDSEIMNEAKANKASLKSAKQLGKKGMNATDEFGPTILRSILYAIHILEENKTKPEDVLHQLRDLVPDYYRERNRISALAEFISKKTTTLRPEESSNAIVLRDLVRREKV